ncbi:endonuclease [Persephonella sp.]
MGKEDFIRVYNKLLDFFGYQNWWPVHNNTDPFIGISIGAILTQNTSWKNVEKAIENLIREDLLDLEKLDKISQENLQKVIKPAGFYVRKAKTIKEFVKKIKNIKKEEITRDFLLSIHGIGKETADSILLYALDKPYFVVDAYTKRIFSRLGFFDEKLSYNQIQEIFHKNLPVGIEIYKEYHALIVALGKNFCKRKPVCTGCPLFDNCKFRIYNV